MSRDGLLPPGCTEKDVDMAAPGYWEGEWNSMGELIEEPFVPSEQDRLFEDLFRMRELADDIAKKGIGYRAALMEVIAQIIKDNNLDRFAK